MDAKESYAESRSVATSIGKENYMSGRLHYNNYIILRDLLTELNENENPDDRLTEDELSTLEIVNAVIKSMEDMRRREDAGEVPSAGKRARERRAWRAGAR